MNIPGFVDLQVNGYKGIDFSNPELTEEEFTAACHALLDHGTVAFLPTIITSSAETFERNLRLMARSIIDNDLRESIPGFHVEGPFISGEDGARGAHNAEWVRKPDINFLQKLDEWSGGNIKLLTIAAETEGADDLCRYATDNLGITVSLGHQMAGENDLDKLAHSGARSLTHLGNGIPRLLPRHHNPLWAGIGNDDLTAMIIADGHHLPPAILKAIIRTKGTSKIIVVSDASPIAGLPPGTYNTLGNDVILEESGLLHNPETGYLVGSSSSMLECMNYLKTLDLLSGEELARVGFYNPLELIGIAPSDVLAHADPSIELKDGQFCLI
ncbi:N-acetylglucosamine-6-phosphate deacetylase [Fodinibius sediminis]|uniref:N-acetylglucosamine-6-phosphate deacetylase n=1 Tax=Fodinibius sediminis TaxID=1214077 RepID=A0A521CVM5_9BACT|nr:amidohydrolase family protein [Fodinibius sediminis]SMO62720.1 N-acetylglucosamine-6-phosphate deacetylase [Fodinibius sediminis]